MSATGIEVVGVVDTPIRRLGDGMTWTKHPASTTPWPITAGSSLGPDPAQPTVPLFRMATRVAVGATFCSNLDQLAAQVGLRIETSSDVVPRSGVHAGARHTWESPSHTTLVLVCVTQARPSAE